MRAAINTSVWFGFLAILTVPPVATAQIVYSFTSGFSDPEADGFQWPESPTGLLNGEGFYTPDNVGIYNFIGNNLFFDSQYQVVGNAPGFSGAAT